MMGFMIKLWDHWWEAKSCNVGAIAEMMGSLVGCFNWDGGIDYRASPKKVSF